MISPTAFTNVAMEPWNKTDVSIFPPTPVREPSICRRDVALLDRIAAAAAAAAGAAAAGAGGVYAF